MSNESFFHKTTSLGGSVSPKGGSISPKYPPSGLVHYLPLQANDNCDYDSDGNGSRDANWAINWQNTHKLGVDWYNCSPAHSQALNGNLKAYAAWWLWARLAGWDAITGLPPEVKNAEALSVFPNPSNGKFNVFANIYSINEIEIYNLSGAKLFSKSYIKLTGKNEIDISEFENGIYLLKIYCGDKIHTEKIVIQ